MRVRIDRGLIAVSLNAYFSMTQLLLVTLSTNSKLLQLKIDP